MYKYIPLLVLTGLLSGCLKVGPDYLAPAPGSPVETDDLTDGQGTEILFSELARWWQLFGDEDLNQLIQDGLAGSYTIEAAQSRIRQARALVQVASATNLPILDAAGSATRGRHQSLALGGTGTETLYSAGFDARWEIDIFGGNRRRIEAAAADLQAVEISLDSLRVSLTSEIAATYILLRGFQQQLAVAESNLRAQAETLDILESRFDSGLSNKLAVQQARYNLERTRSTLPPLRVSIEQSINSLAVLVGKQPGDLQAALKPVKDIPSPPVTTIKSIPADAIRQRPDIRRAERILAAETARIGVAQSELYPKFFLNGTIGLEALSTGNFFSDTNRTNTFGPGFSWNIFSAGAIRNRTKAQMAVADAARADYHQTLLEAFKEVRDALIAHSQEQLRYEALNAAVTAATLAEEIARDQYTNGLTDFNNVLDAQRSLFNLQAALTESKATITGNMVRIYKAMGGGF